ncbi:MAG: ABC transporter ATP-binding protein [Magnetospirillum sp. WYHS-4]
MTEMIALNGLTKHFGPLVAVDGITLSVKRGEVLGFLGPNGAGKSTTMKMVTGFLTPTAGTARVCGHDVVEEPVAVKRRIGYLPEGAPTYGDMTAGAFLDFIGEIRGFKGADLRRQIDRVVEIVALADVLKQPIETLSKGFKRRVGLAQAMLHDPEVLILDEPTDGLDPNQKHHVREVIREMAAEKAIVISTHILEEVGAICTRAVIIAHGRLLADGTAEELQARMPYHHAVAVTVAAADVEKAKAKLEAIAPIDVVPNSDGTVKLRVPALDGQPRLAEVADLLKAKHVPARELTVERGRLDEVFRAITKGETTEDKGGADA